MKKMRKVLIILLVALFIVGCGGKGDGEENDSKGDKKSILTFVVTNLGDFGFADLAAAATKDVAEKYDMDYKIIESGVDSSTYVTTLLDAIETGDYDYVISPSWYVQDDLLAKADNEFKDITFILFDTNPTLDLSMYDNVIGISYKQNEGSFLTAVYSSLMTETNKVGAILGSDRPILNDFGAGYLNGVKWFNDNYEKDVDYVLTYLGETTINEDYETAKVVYSNGVDILYNVAGSVTLGAAKAAEDVGGFDKGYAVIGVDSDQWTIYKNAEGQDVTGYNNLISSMLKNIRETINWAFDGIVDGSLDYTNHRVGIKEGGVGIAKNDNYYEHTPKEVQDEIEKVEKMIEDGEIEIKSYFDFDSYEEFEAYRDKPETR